MKKKTRKILVIIIAILSVIAVISSTFLPFIAAFFAK